MEMMGSPAVVALLKTLIGRAITNTESQVIECVLDIHKKTEL